jgi:hypothetical protein
MHDRPLAVYLAAAHGQAHPSLPGDRQGGARLFVNLGDARPRLEPLRVAATPEVTHLKYRVVK